MKIAYTMAAGRGDTDLLLNRVARRLAQLGTRCRGTVQINTDRDAGPCDMDVQVLPDGPVLRISQDLGAASRGCRLDPNALELAVGQVAVSLDAGADLLIINKFGKHEAEGRGFRDVIAKAVTHDIPVIVGVNALNLEAFETFAGPDVTQLNATPEAIMDWVETEVRHICFSD